MKCHACLRQITSGAEAAKRIETREIRTQLPTDLVPFGVGMAAGSLADGEKHQLAYAEHGKCYHARTRAAERQQAKAAELGADPGFEVREDRDWRDPVTMDLEELLCEGDGDTGQAGRAGQRVR